MFHEVYKFSVGHFLTRSIFCFDFENTIENQEFHFLTKVYKDISISSYLITSFSSCSDTCQVIGPLRCGWTWRTGVGRFPGDTSVTGPGQNSITISVIESKLRIVFLSTPCKRGVKQTTISNL